MEHKFFEITRTPLVNVAKPGDPPALIHDLDGETQIVVGCESCDMGLAEATASPNCLGKSLESLLED